jgi:hypothetical protein
MVERLDKDDNDDEAGGRSSDLTKTTTKPEGGLAT